MSLISKKIRNRHHLIFVLLIGFLLKPGYTQIEKQVKNIETFAKIYGYVRFFYPGDEAASTNWGKFAIYGCKKVEKCNSSKELQKVLKELFLPIAPGIKIFPTKDDMKFNAAEITPKKTGDLKVVSWQHLGVNLGRKSNIYKSVRTNRETIYKSKPDFGSLTTSYNIIQYQEKEFRFLAKVSVEQGTGHLWARIDRKGGQPGFFDNMRDRPITNKKWQEYKVEGKIDKDGEKLAFGCFLLGEGKLFVDDLKLFIKEDNLWKEVYSNSFENDKVGSFPKSISKGIKKDKSKSGPPGYEFIVGQSSSNKINNCVSIKSREEQIIKEKATILFDAQIKIGEYVKKEIGPGLSSIIPLAVYGNTNFTFPQAGINKSKKLKENLEKLKDEEITGKNIYTRLAGLVICWNVFQHFYPYFDVIKTDWHKDLREALKEAYQNKTGYDFLKTLQKMTAKLKDGHISIYSKSNKMETHALPIEWEWIENQLVITSVLVDNLSINKGDIVTSIDGKAPRQYFKKIEKYISAATKGWLNYKSKFRSLLGKENSAVQLSIKKPDNSYHSITLKRSLRTSKYYSCLPKKDQVKKISNDIYYINIGETPMSKINDIMPELERCKAIICDLRGYPRGNHNFIKHLMKEKDTSDKWMRIPQIIYPDQENIAGYRNTGWLMEPLKPHLKAEIIFIIDGRAISYAESFMSFIEHYKLATMIGQPTAGTNGNVNPIYLPGGYRIGWTGMKVVKHDGSQHHGIGIIPDILVEKTIKGVRENRDEFLEKAIKIAKKE